MLFDLLIEKRLRDCRIVDLTVPMAPVTDQVDDDVGAEFIAIFGGNAGDANDRVNVFGIDVEDWNRLAASNASGKARGVLFGVASGEAEKIVDDHVNGAANE